MILVCRALVAPPFVQLALIFATKKAADGIAVSQPLSILSGAALLTALLGS